MWYQTTLIYKNMYQMTSEFMTQVYSAFLWKDKFFFNVKKEKKRSFYDPKMSLMMEKSKSRNTGT